MTLQATVDVYNQQAACWTPAGERVRQAGVGHLYFDSRRRRLSWLRFPRRLKDLVSAAVTSVRPHRDQRSATGRTGSMRGGGQRRFQHFRGSSSQAGIAMTLAMLRDCRSISPPAAPKRQSLSRPAPRPPPHTGTAEWQPVELHARQLFHWLCERGHVNGTILATDLMKL